MKKSKKNYAMIALVVILLCLAIGYAAFSANLTINGTATASGTWEVKFIKAEMNDEDHGTAEVTSSDEVTVNAKLAFPGDACTVTVYIKNNGTIPAELTSFECTKADGTTVFTDDNIEVVIPDIETGDEIIKAGETCPVTITVKWKADSTATNATASFKVKFEYKQPEEVEVTPSHNTHTNTL